MTEQKAFMLEIKGELPVVCETIDIAEELCKKWIRENNWYPDTVFSNLCDFYDYSGHEGFCCHNVFHCYPVTYCKRKKGSWK